MVKTRIVWAIRRNRRVEAERRRSRDGCKKGKGETVRANFREEICMALASPRPRTRAGKGEEVRGKRLKNCEDPDPEAGARGRVKGSWREQKLRANYVVQEGRMTKEKPAERKEDSDRAGLSRGVAKAKSGSG